MKLPEIIGIAGTNASGKDTLGELRAELQHAKMVSLSDILRFELDKRGIRREREHLRALSAEWRAESGPGVLSTKSIELYESEKKELGYTGLSLVSLRNPAEVVVIQQAGGIVIWVDADRRTRYERILARGIGRPEDEKTFEEFCAEEDVEMNLSPDSDEKTGLNMSAVRDIADIKITNEFSSVQEYKDYLIKEFELT